MNDDDGFGTPEAIRIRQEELIHLIRGLRAFSVALVCLFVVIGVVCAVLFAYLRDTRATTRRLQDQQTVILCDAYHNQNRPLPDGLDCS